jgi:hypothetical protein
LTEDWDPDGSDDDNNEKYLTARAAIGTLAVAATDEEVVFSLCKEDIAKSIVIILSTKNEELVHRVLVLLKIMLQHECSDQFASHLAEGNVIPSIAVTTSMNRPDLRELAKEVVELFTDKIG